MDPYNQGHHQHSSHFPDRHHSPPPSQEPPYPHLHSPQHPPEHHYAPSHESSYPHLHSPQHPPEHQHTPPHHNPPETHFAQPPPQPHFSHVEHHAGVPGYSAHESRPYLPPHESEPQLPRGQLVKLVCKVDRDYQIACGHDGVVIAPADPRDEAQQWIKDDSFGVRVKDNFGFPAFSLINKAHKKVLKRAKEKGQQVLLVDYKPDLAMDDDILWTQSQEFEEGYKTVRLASDTLLNMTVFHNDKKSKGLKNGSPIILDTWHKQDHQLWKILPLCKHSNPLFIMSNVSNFTSPLEKNIGHFR